MPEVNLVLLAIPVLLIAGMIVQLVRARRRGLRGRSAFIAIFKPVKILMQGTAAGRGLPAERLEVRDTPADDLRGSSLPL
jgi:hypothetical protein